MDDLYILGAGGTSREIIEIVEDINDDQHRWNICGLLDDDPSIQGRYFSGVPVIGPIAPVAGRQGFFVMGIASFRNRHLRRQITDRMGLSAERYASLIHPSAMISRRTRIGAGAVIQANSVIGPDACIGEHVLVGPMCFVGHDATLADFSTLAPQVCVAGGAIIGPGAYLGAGSTIRETVTIGQGALVGIGSVVIDHVGPDATVFGNPARPVQASVTR